jgi:hypothetical protein
MSTTFLFYIVKGFGLIKRGMGVKRKCNHFKCNQGFSSKAACHKKKKLTCHQGIIFPAVMLVLSESFHVFESQIACRCNRFPSRRRRRAALSIWHQLTQSIQRGESSFQEKCMNFHEIHPRVAYDLAHVCISWSVYTNKWRTTHSALCGYYKFSFRIFIWVYLNFSEYKQ